MRYAVISKGMNISQLIDAVNKIGGRNVKSASQLQQVFCDMEEAQAAALANTPGLAVKVIKKVSSKFTETALTPAQVRVPATPDVQQNMVEALDTYSTLQGSLFGHWYELRNIGDPPITGVGGCCAVLDTGIRKTHRGLLGKVIHEANFSDSPTLDDIYDHGTGVAYIMCGGKHMLGQDCGLAPGMKVMSIKVLDDDGEGTEENVVLGLEEVIELIHSALDQGLVYPDPRIITAVNMSFGAEDDNDPDNPIRVAARAVTQSHKSYTGYRMMVIAAAGNGGPNPGTIAMPACDAEVFAIGSCSFSPFAISQSSSRGPSKEGVVKPDAVFFGENIMVASSKSDDAYVVKSGTSFASPFAVGGGFTSWETIRRYVGEDAVMDDVSWREWAKTISVKSSGYKSGEKDNVWGWGLPMGDKLVALATGAAVPQLILTETTNMIVPIMTLAMVGMMMSGMAKSMK